MTPLKRGPFGRYRVGAGPDETPISTCWLCAAAAQIALNWLLLLDFALNTALMGSPNETLSQRTARARRAGSKPAALFCAVLTWAFNLLGAKEDHCTFSLRPGSLGQEVWAWSADTPNPPPPPQDR